jgi:hypothetical protein
MKGQGEVKLALANASVVVQAAMEQRDRRIDTLEWQLDEARKPRTRVLLVGGPSAGDIHYARPGTNYIEVLQPMDHLRVHEYVSEWTNPGNVRVAHYRFQRVRCADGEHTIGLFEGIR